MSLHDLVKSSSNIDAVREKVVTGADVDEVDKLKRTPIHLAAWSGNLEALQVLVRANAKIDAKAMDGFTAVHFAAQSSAEGASNCIRFLVKKNKALLNMRITKGNKSALHLAAAKGNVAAVEALIEIGADIMAKSTSGQTPADLAKTPEIRAMLAAGPVQKTKAPDASVADVEEQAADDGAAVGAKQGAMLADASLQPAKSDGASCTDAAATGSRKRPISDVVEE
jgi:ankyrin repeat protein